MAMIYAYFRHCKFAGLSAFMVLALAAGAGLVSCAKAPVLGGAAALPPLAVQPPVIYVTNDIHLLAESLHDGGAAYEEIINQRDGKFTEFIDPIMRAFTAQVIADKPSIVLANGDLTFNGERESHEALAQHFLRMEKAGVKVFVLPGNHDIRNPHAAQFFDIFALEAYSVTPKEFRSIYRRFGYGEAISRDPHSLSYIAEPVKGLRLLMLDSCKYEQNRNFPVSGGEIKQGTLDWIKTNVSKAQKAGYVFVAAMHHSSMSHHPQVNENFTIGNDEILHETLVSLGIPFILTGHIHAQSISQRQTSVRLFYDIATSALSVYPHQFGVLSYQIDGSWQYATKFVDVEGWARATQQTDSRLFNFSELASVFFSRNAESMVRRRIGQAAVSPEELAALTDLLATVNKRYFAGTASRNGVDVFESRGWKLLQSGRFESLAHYVNTIVADEQPLNTDAIIPRAVR